MELADFNTIAQDVPLLGNLAPGGAYHMTDLDRVGGVTALMKVMTILYAWTWTGWGASRPS